MTSINSMKAVLAVLNEIADEYRNHCLANGDDNTVAWIDSKMSGLEELEQQEQEPESLFRRLAEHPYHGRGVIISNALNENRRVRFAHKIKAPGDNIGVSYVDYAHLKTEPTRLEKIQDFNDVPDGTIVEMMTEPKDVYVKEGSVWYGTGDDYATSANALGKARVIRWGDNDN